MKPYILPALIFLAACGDDVPIGHSYGPCLIFDKMSFINDDDLSIERNGKTYTTKWKRGEDGRVIIFPVGYIGGDESRIPYGIITKDGDLDMSGFPGFFPGERVCKKIT